MPDGEQLGAIVSPIIAALTFVWGIYVYVGNDSARRKQLADEREADLNRRRIEATRPFLERQLALYSEATRAASTIASPPDAAARAAAELRFLQLFWGEMAMVEDSRVEDAMIAFRKALTQGVDDERLGGLSAALAHACRDSLAQSWGTSAWQFS